MKPEKITARTQTEAERAEREELFGFHPEILAEAADLPRKNDGSAYSGPRSGSDD